MLKYKYKNSVQRKKSQLGLTFHDILIVLANLLTSEAEGGEPAETAAITPAAIDVL